MIQVVVAYDIKDDKRRNRIAKCLQGYGSRVNFSVFECILKAGPFMKMKEELNRLTKQKDDNVRIYQVCRECIKKAEVIGSGPEGFDSENILYV